MDFRLRYRYRIVVVVFLCVLATNALCRYAGLLDGHYGLRKWLWYALSLSTFALVLSRKKVLNLFKGINSKGKVNPLYLLCIIGSVFLSSLFNLLFFPTISDADRTHYLRQDYASFEHIRRLTDSLITTGETQTKYTFYYTGKRFDIQWDSARVREYNGDRISATTQDELYRFMYRNELRTIIVEQNKITYFFNGLDTDYLVRLKGADPALGWKRVDSVYFLTSNHQ